MTLITPSLNFTNQVDGVSVNLENVVWDPTRELVVPTQPISGSLTNTQPIDENKTQVNAIMGLGPNTSFYNRILIEPAVLSLGNLVSAQTRQVTVWNGYLDGRDLTSFATLNAVGIDVLQPVAVPYTIAALQQLQYEVNVSLEGPASIDAQLQWVIDGETYTAVITGSRVVIFPFGPNWKLSKFTETLNWKTDILRMFDGGEQRISLRTKARRSFSYTASVTRETSSKFDNLMWGWQNRVFALPVWSDKSHLAEAAFANDTQINLPTLSYGFTAGSLAIFFQDETTFEVVEIDQVIDGALKLLRPVQQPWPADTLVMPVVLAHLPTQVSVSRYTSDVLAAQLSFVTDPANTDPYIPDAPAPITYQGLEVVLRQPNWQSQQEHTSEYLFQTLDNDIGTIQWQPTETFQRDSRSYPWLLRDRTQIQAFREMLGRLRGAAKTLWVPTWHADFTVVAEIGAAETSIQVKDNGFRQLSGVDPARNHVMLRLRDGRNLFGQITSVAQVGENTSLGLLNSFGFPITLDMVHSLHLLMRSRLTTDQVSLVWQSTGVAVADTNFTTVRE